MNCWITIRKLFQEFWIVILAENSFYLLLVELQIFRFANFDVRTFCQLKDCDDDENCGRRWRLLSEHSINFISWIHSVTLLRRLFSCLSELLTNFISTLTWFSFYFHSHLSCLFLLKSFHQTSRFTAALVISDVNTSMPLARLKRLLMKNPHSTLSAPFSWKYFSLHESGKLKILQANLLLYYMLRWRENCVKHSLDDNKKWSRNNSN